MKNKHGGKRKGAGKKQKYGEPTITMRVPKSKKQAIKNFIEKITNKKAN